MKKYRKSATGMALAGLVVLVMLSSCDLRRSLTSYFDMPFVKALNVSKTTVATSSCDFSEDSVVRVNSNSDSESSHLAFALPAEAVSKVFDYLSLKNIPLFSPPRKLAQRLPFYILFKRLKVDA